MIKSFTVTNYIGDSIKLILGEPEKSGFLIKNVEGLGPIKATVNTTELSTNDGSIFNSAKLTSRNIVFDIIFLEVRDANYNILESIEDVRQKSYKYFGLKKKVDLVIETDNRIVRTSGYVESNEPDIFSEQESTQISIICPDPFLYGDTVVSNLHSVEPEFEFPFSNESLDNPILNMGEIHLTTQRTIVYRGDHDVGMTIRIHAIESASSITIKNVDTGEFMILDNDKIASITGSGIIGKDDIVINTVKGKKSITLVRDGVSYNILNCLGKDTDWFTLTRGDNRIAFMAEEGISDLRFSIENDILYEGV